MSYEEFKRRIDTARQILVGAVPSPAGQIDQITYALIYKFMNDIDDKAVKLPGGKRTYFVGDYEKYNWHNLMSPSLGAHDRLELYRQAIQGMAKNENLPELFRSIYQNAFLPFNSPHVLNLFLKEIDQFSHSDSDDIGDAYEYLLSITGAQGDVGQFRTPRHIIKFIVEAVNPTKSDSVLDPACGTAGFLIAAYNHVKHQHDGKDEQGRANDEVRLSSDELDKLHHNYRGFDIDPTMVRTAKVNLYLHGFKTPDIINHDTLSNEDYWNDRYDVILANPPFMTPKGGIQPHKKFSVNANRAEVLFVDYIASHLKPNGRAGVIVPEGIIFQSGNAYKQLRKNLVENYLYAVVSLPAGVFQPYSGVKTSILLLDKQLAKERDEIIFIDIKSDGYSLTTSRSKVTGNQLPNALNKIVSYKNNVEEIDSALSFLVPRKSILEDRELNLTGARYRLSDEASSTEHTVIELADVLYESTERVKDSSVPVWSVSNKLGFINPDEHFSKQVASENISNYKLVRSNYFAYNPSRINVGSIALNKLDSIGCVSPMYVVFRIDKSSLLADYLFYMLKSEKFDRYINQLAQGAVRTQLRFKDLVRIKIPLPPIEIQREIVAELDGYQKIIDAAQTIVQTYKPTFKVNPDWRKCKIDDIAHLISGGTPSRTNDSYWGGDIKWITSKYFSDEHKITGYENITQEGINNSSSNIAPTGATIIISRVSVGKYAYADKDYALNQDLTALVVKDPGMLDARYLLAVAYLIADQVKRSASGIGVVGVTKQFIKDIEIPIPSIETQREIVAKLEAEQKLIDANKKLIEIYQQKIKSKLANVWGD